MCVGSFDEMKIVFIKDLLFFGGVMEYIEVWKKKAEDKQLWCTAIERWTKMGRERQRRWVCACVFVRRKGLEWGGGISYRDNGTGR